MSTPPPAEARADASPAKGAAQRPRRGGCLWRLFKAGVQVTLFTLLFLFVALYFWLKSAGFQERVLPVVDYLVETQTGGILTVSPAHTLYWARIRPLFTRTSPRLRMR